MFMRLHIQEPTCSACTSLRLAHRLLVDPALTLSRASYMWDPMTSLWFAMFGRIAEALLPMLAIIMLLSLIWPLPALLSPSISHVRCLLHLGDELPKIFLSPVLVTFNLRFIFFIAVTIIAQQNPSFKSLASLRFKAMSAFFKPLCGPFGAMFSYKSIRWC